MGLADVLKDDTKKSSIIKECAELVDQEVASKSGLSGFAVKAGYGAVKGIKPTFVTEVIDKLLPEFAAKMDPIWAESLKESQPLAYFRTELPDIVRDQTGCYSRREPEVRRRRRHNPGYCKHEDCQLRSR